MSITGMNTDIGAKPELVWIAIDDLSVDASYQRSTESRTSQKLIEKIAREFHWSKFTPLAIAPRTGESKYAIIDGQHRVQACILRGDIAEVPAMLSADDSVQGQAKSFVGINKNRVKVHKMAEYYADLAAGDEQAQLVRDICHEADVAIAKSPVPSDRMKPNETLAISSLKKCARLYGREVLVKALKAIRLSFPDDAGNLKAGFIECLCRILKQPPAHFSYERLLDIVQETDPDHLQDCARNYCKVEGGQVMRAMERIMVNEYNKGLPKAQRLEAAS